MSKEAIQTECRLVMTHIPRTGVNRLLAVMLPYLAAASLAAPTVPAMADNNVVTCAEYAAAAVTRARENAKLSCGFTGSRWADDHAGHLKWCQTVATAQLVRRELDIRLQQMQACKQKIADKNKAPCRLYAVQAVAQNSLNKSYKCGFGGGNWSDDSQGHQNWCIKVGYKTAKARAADFRDRKLQECKSKPIVHSPAWGKAYRGERLPVDVCSRNSNDNSASAQLCGKANAQLFCTLKGDGNMVSFKTASKDRRSGTFSAKADGPVSWYLDANRPCFGKCSFFTRVVCKRAGT